VKRLISHDSMVKETEHFHVEKEINRQRRIRGLAHLETISTFSSAELYSSVDKLTPKPLAAALSLLATLNLTFHDFDSGFPFLIASLNGSSNPIKVKLLRNVLKHAIDAGFREDWAEMDLEGECTNAINNVPLAPASVNGCHIRNPGLFSENQRRFAFLCVSNNINCETNKVRWGFSSSPTCTLCGASSGSTRHVLNVCEKRLALIKARHDSVLNVLAREARIAHPDAQILVDNTPDPRISGTSLRPDIIISQESPSKRFAAILDVKCPFPVRDLNQVTFTHKSDELNITKYDPIARAYQ
jgi:hypothetical protein